jgi:two-component system LytT family response regulator
VVGKVRSVPVEQIDYITASGSYVEMHVRDGDTMRRYVIREAMQALEARGATTRSSSKVARGCE